VDHGRRGRGTCRLIRPSSALLFLLLLLTWAVPAHAQSFEAVGIRAQGMGGAFVAVADDASAVWWNPAGLAGGALFSAILERPVVRRPDDADGAARAGEPAEELRTGGLSVAYPALGASYYRVRIYQETVPASTDTSATDRQDQGPARVSLRALSVSHFGVTIGQSFGEHVVLSTTVKLLRGSAAVEDVPVSEASLDRARELDAPGETRGDLDVGVMARFGVARVGVAVRNLAAPAFGEGMNRMQLTRRVRAGVSVTTGPLAVLDSVTVAADADLTTNDTAFGRERRLAAGAEAWLLRRHVGIRGGLSGTTVGDAPRALSGGVSVGIWSGVYLEGFITGGDSQGRHGWGSDLRLTY
jgi:hypothetical protein